MDVQLPDGTIIEGVPEGTTKSQLMAKYEKMKAIESAPKQESSFLDDVGNFAIKTASEGSPFGIAKPISSALAVPIQKAMGDERPIGELYKQNRQIFEQGKQQFEQDNPWTSAAITVGSMAVPTGITKIPGVGKVLEKAEKAFDYSKDAGKLEKIAKTTGKLAATGAASAGATNYITSDQEGFDAAKSALGSALVGGVAAPVIGLAAGKIANKIADNFAPKFANSTERQFASGLSDLKVGSETPIARGSLVPDMVNDVAIKQKEMLSGGLPAGLAYIARESASPELPNAFVSQKLQDIQSRGIAPQEAAKGAYYVNNMNRALQGGENAILPNISKDTATDSLITSANKRVEQTQKLAKKASSGFETAKSFDDLPEQGQNLLNKYANKYPLMEDYLNKAEIGLKESGVQFPTYGQKFSYAQQLIQKRIDNFKSGGLNEINPNAVKLDDVTSKEYSQLLRSKEAINDIQRKFNPEFKQAASDYKTAAKANKVMAKTGTVLNQVKTLADMLGDEAKRPQAIKMITRLDSKGIESIKSEIGKDAVKDAFLADLRDRVQKAPQAGSKLFEQSYLFGDKDFSTKLKQAIGNEQYEGLKQFYKTKQNILTNADTIPNFIRAAGKDPTDKGGRELIEAIGYGTSGSKQVTASKATTAIKKFIGIDNTANEIELLFDPEKGQKFLKELASGKFSDIEKREKLIKFIMEANIGKQIGQDMAETDNNLLKFKEK